MRDFLLPALLLLGACGETTSADVLRAVVWPIPIPDSLFATAEPEAEWDVAAAEPADGAVALALSLGSRRGLAMLVQEEGERRMWRTAGGVVVATEGPRVVAVAGLRQVLAATRFEGPDPLARIGDLGAAAMAGTRVVDVMRWDRNPSRMRFGLRLTCLVSAGPAEVEDTLLVQETCRGAARFTNRFWADARSYAVFRSEQWVGDDLPPLVVEVRGPPVAPPAEIIPLPR